MARTAQTAGGGSVKVAYMQHFNDHAGNRALRIGTCLAAQDGSVPGPPSDFAKDPKFCFQVYASVQLDLEDEQPPAKRARGNDDSLLSLNRSKFGLLKSLLAKDLHEAQCSDPIWEIYILPGQDALAFVDHSRREIAHRKVQRKQGDVSVPLIAKLALSDTDERKAGFLFGIDRDVDWYSGGQEHKTPEKSKLHPDGVLWVHFDQRIPFTVTKTEYALQLEETVGTMGLEEDEIRVWPEQIDVLVKRIQNTEEAQYRLPTMFSLSCLSEEYRDEDENLGMGFELDNDDGSDQTAGVLTETEIGSLESAASKLKLGDGMVKLQHNDDGSITISTNKEQASPDLKYVVYVPFLHQPGAAEKLEEAAKAFAAAMETRLPPIGMAGKTFLLDFHKPSETSDSCILGLYRALHQPAGSIGFLTASNEAEQPPGTQSQESSAGSQHRRLHPININPHMTLNDPSTCGFEPYRTFVIILDRPDFATDSEKGTAGVAAVRLLLADGGNNIEDAEMDYLEIQVWRSLGMDEVVKRLTLMPLPG